MCFIILAVALTHLFYEVFKYQIVSTKFVLYGNKFQIGPLVPTIVLEHNMVYTINYKLG